MGSHDGRGALAERWNGTNWKIKHIPIPTGAAETFLTGVSCASKSACTAAGYYNRNGTNDLTLAERWNGTRWKVQHTPNPAGAIQTFLSGVSCASKSACTAAGRYLNHNDSRISTLVEHWTGG